MSTPSLIPARDEHRDAIMAVLKTANMHHIPSQEMPHLDLRHAWVAVMDDTIVGFSAITMLDETRAKTTLLAVLPECRKHGIGRMLQERRMHAAIELGATTLTTNADRPETIDWYMKYFGYQKIGYLKKNHEFGLPRVDEWTTLLTDLLAWSKHHDG